MRTAILTFGALLGAFGVVAACGSDRDTGAGPADDGGGGSADGTAQHDAVSERTGTDARGPGAPPQPAPFGLDTRPANASCVAPARPATDVAVAFERVFAGVTLGSPMMMGQIPGDATRVFVAQRSGTIVSFPVAAPPTGAPTTVATVANVNADGEGGLLGIAFDPAFAQNGRLYVSFTAEAPGVSGSQMRSTIARLTSTDSGATFGSYTELLAFDQSTATNHKGGSIAFGLDGFLYFGFGDGGGGGDSFINGQNKGSFFGKIHRIDVTTPPAVGQAYVIPSDNPFKNGGGKDTTYAYGIRNPFRFSFDRISGDLWLGDVGQDLYEEVDRIRAPGGNLGWPCREGLHPYAPTLNDAARCPNEKAAFVEPVTEYPHAGGQKAIIGGVVYRGKAVPQMVGTYIFGDEVAGSIWALKYDANNVATRVLLNPQGPNGNWSQFAEDNEGELYAVDLGGRLYKMSTKPGVDAGTPGVFPDALSKTGCVDPANPKTPSSGLIPYTVNSPLWSDGADKERWMAIPDGKKIAIGKEGHLDLPIGSILMKTFALGGKRIETRLLVHHADDGWAGYTYEWNDAETDATLLPSSKSKMFANQSWYYPSRSDCFSCHSGAASRTLGMELGQLNGDDVYPATNRVANQLATLDHIGIFEAPLASPVGQIVAYPTPTKAGPLEARARSYLHANCAMCHRPDGNGGGPMDLRFAVGLESAKSCNVAPDNGDLGVSGAKILAPGDAAKSLLSLRPHALDATRMPPLATHRVDTDGVSVIDMWIQSLTACPAKSTDAGDQ